MTLQKRTTAPGKARRAASKGKPRRAAAAKAAKKAAPAPRTTAKSPARTSSAAKKTTSSKPATTVRYSDRDDVAATRKKQRLTDRSKLRAKRFQEKTASKSKDVEGAVKGSPRQTAQERTFEKGGKPKTRAAKFVSDRKERTDRPRRTESSDRPARPARTDKPVRSFDKPVRSDRPARDRRTTTHRSEPHNFSKARGRNVAEDFGADDSYISPNLADANLIDAAPGDSVQKSFRDLGVPAALDNALNAQGILSPFPIQVATLPDAIAGHDILGRGQTGSGKTLAFSLALLSNIAGKQANPHKPLALILTPTRELAQQIDEVLLPLARAVGHASVVVAGGMSYSKQITAMRKGTAILVATPGRLIDLLNKGEVQLDQLQITVLDEADQMADMGFLPVVQEILDQAKQGGQRLLFSATLDRGVDALVRRYLKNPKTHSLQNDRASVSTMEHYLIVMDPSDKDEVTAEIAARNGKTILFVKTQRGADRLADKLAHAGVAVGALHGGKSQAVRTRTLALFKESENAALVATDVAARGIHVDGISLVVHVDPAQDHKDYLHRSGRTARAGESGTVVSLATTRQQKSVKSLTTRAGVNPSTVYVKPGSEDLMRVTGAQQPSGIPYVPPVVEAPKRAPRKGGSGGGRGYRGNRSGGNGGRGRR